MKTIHKINILTGPFCCIPPHSIGAIEKRWFSVGNHWRKKGYYVTFISKIPEKGVINKKDKDNVYIKGYKRTGNRVCDILLDLIYSYKALWNAPESDIIVINSVWGPVLYPLFKKKFKGALYNVARYPKKQMSLYKAVDCLACVSNPIKAAVIQQSSQLKEKVCVIPNPIDTNIYNSKNKKELSVTPILIYTGRVHKEKGLDILVKAISILKQQYNIEIKLRIIGATKIEDGGSGDEYVSYLNSLAYSNDIEWIEAIYNPIELAQEIEKGDIYCYPSVAEKGESFGCAPLEAMGLGLPTIVSDLDCFKDFVNNGINGMIFNHRIPNAHLELADCIKKLVTDKTLYSKLSEEAIITASKFSIESVANQYMSVFNKIVNHAPIND